MVFRRKPSSTVTAMFLYVAPCWIRSGRTPLPRTAFSFTKRNARAMENHVSHSARRRARVIAGSSVLAAFSLMTPAYAAAPGHSAAPAATSFAAGPRTLVGALVQPGGVRHLVGPGTIYQGARNVTVSSINWSGYAATGGTGAFTSVSSSWVEPTVKCSSGDQYSSFWVGLDGSGNDSVEQTGSGVDCAGRTPEYYSWCEMFPVYPVNFSNTVRPGDHFTGSVTYTGGNSFTLKLSDTTQGWSHIVTKTLFGAARSSAEVIVEAPCCTTSGGILPLAHFRTVSFLGSTVNGSPLSTFHPIRIRIVPANGTAEDSISALHGGSFNATWLSSGNGRRAGPRGQSRRLPNGQNGRAG